MFQLTWEEVSLLKSQILVLDGITIDHSRSQIVILKQGRNIKYPPFAFTEQGVAMLSSVLRSKRAIEVNILNMRAFVKLREMIATNKNLARRLDELEKKYDGQFRVVFEAIRQLMTPPVEPKRKIGFELKEKQGRYGRGK